MIVKADFDSGIGLRVLHVSSMWPTDDCPGSGTFVYDLVSALRRTDGIHDVVHIKARASKFNYVRAVGTISGLLESGFYDIVHAQYAHSAIVSRLASDTVPVLAHFHGEFGYNYREGHASGLKGLLDQYKCYRDAFLARIIARDVEGVAVVQKRDLEQIDNDLKEVIPIGSDSNKFYPDDPIMAREKLGLDPSLDYVLFPADPKRPDKNYGLFTEVIRILQNKRDKLEAMILYGIPHDLVPNYMNAANVLLLTSFSEASPTVIKEANLCGLPIVSVPVGDAEIQLKGVVPGGVYEPEPSILADAVESILNTGARSNGRPIALQSWTIADTVDKTLAFYKKILMKRIK
ncbi:MAG: glycosyltransferase family 4 protein [Sphaerochaetaceae bacterium]|nr:glycosyltransferase family 4 protein [Sphaerochaetaceae bacterium]